MRTHTGALQGRIPQAWVGQEASCRRTKGAHRREGQGTLVSRGFGGAALPTCICQSW